MVRSLASAGLEVDVATTNDDGGHATRDVPFGQPIDEDGVRYFYFSRQTRFYKVSLPLARWLDQQVARYDLVHVHAVFSYASVVGAKKAHQHRVPYIVQPHGILNRWGMTNRRPLFKQLSFRWIEQKILQRAAAVCFTAKQEQREVMQSLAGITDVPSAVIPLGIDSRFFQPMPPPSVFLEQFPRAKDRSIVLFLSRLDAKKGLDLLLDAFAITHREVSGSLLVIAGEGAPDFVTSLRERAASLGLAEHVLWTGFLSGDTKLSALGAATVFTLPSYSENFGIVVAEALAAGTPCVLSDQVALTEDAVGAEAALGIPCQVPALAGALTRTLTEPDTRQRLSTNAHRYARDHFSMAAAAASLIKFYLAVLQDDTNPPNVSASQS